MGVYKNFFMFAAKAGALEGYLYKRSQTESLTDWVNNMDAMFHQLPQEVQQEVRGEYRSVLEQALKYGAGVLEPEIKARLEGMAAELGPP